jgi:hypothetical protein
MCVGRQPGATSDRDLARWKRAEDYYQPLRGPHEDGHSARGESDYLSDQVTDRPIQHDYMPEPHEAVTPGMPRTPTVTFLSDVHMCMYWTSYRTV